MDGAVMVVYRALTLPGAAVTRSLRQGAARMDMTDEMIADAVAARVAQIRAHELNLAIKAAALRGLLVRVEVGEQGVEDDDLSDAGLAPAVEVSVDKV
jgi:hypothetical protein